MGVSICAALKETKMRFKATGIESWAIDADLLMMKVTNLSREELIVQANMEISGVQAEEFEKYTRRRLKLEPVQYILNKSQFMGLPFYVDGCVLIPRPETECIVEKAVEYINNNKCQRILDMCAGSGCIAVSAAVLCKDLKFVSACDISLRALEIVDKNASIHSVSHKVQSVLSDMFENVEGEFDVIITNPPYIETSEIEALSENVKGFEPITALDGGSDGLYFYRVIAQNAGEHLSSGGRLYLEIGSRQKKDVLEIFKDFSLVETIKDLAGLDRGIVFSK